MELQLFSLAESLTMLKCLDNNGYKCLYRASMDVVEGDIISTFNFDNLRFGENYFEYFIHIDDEDKKYYFGTRMINLGVMRKKKLNNLMYGNR